MSKYKLTIDEVYDKVKYKGYWLVIGNTEGRLYEIINAHMLCALIDETRQTFVDNGQQLIGSRGMQDFLRGYSSKTDTLNIQLWDYDQCNAYLDKLQDDAMAAINHVNNQRKVLIGLRNGLNPTTFVEASDVGCGRITFHRGATK